MAKKEGFFEEPNMSDATLLVTVEDLINRAMGPPDGNVVNFKLIQAILHILARQQRMLEQRVEIRVIEIKKHRSKKKHTDESSDSSSETSSPMLKPQKSPRRDVKRDGADAAFKSKVDKKEREAGIEDTLEKKKKTERTQRDESAPFKIKQTQLMVADKDEEDEDGTEKGNIKALTARKKVPEKGKEEEKRHEEFYNISQKDIRQTEPTKLAQTERIDLEEQLDFKLHDYEKKVRLEEDDGKGERKKYEMSQKEKMESEDEIDQRNKDEITMKGKQILDKRKQYVFENEIKEVYETDDQKERDKIEKKERELLHLKLEEQKQFEENSQKESAVLKNYESELRPLTEKTAGESEKEREKWQEYETEEQQKFERMAKKEKSHQQKIDKISEPQKAGLEEHETKHRIEYTKQPEKEKTKEETDFMKQYLKQLPKEIIKQVEKEESVGEEYEIQKKIERMPQKECRPEKCDSISQKYRTVSDKIYEREEQKEYKVKLQQQEGRKQELSHKETEQLEEYETKYRKEYKEWPQKEKSELVLSQKETEECEMEHQKGQEVFHKERDESEIYEIEDQKKYIVQELSPRKGESEEYEAEVKTVYKKQTQKDKIREEISEKKTTESAKEELEDRKHLYREPRKSKQESSHEGREDYLMEKQKGFEKFQIGQKLERAEAVTIKESEYIIKGEREYDETKLKTLGETQRLDKQQKIEKEDEKKKDKQTTQDERDKLERNGEGFEKDEKITPQETQKWEGDKKREEVVTSPRQEKKKDKREKVIPKVKEGFEKEKKISGKERKRQDKIEELPAQDGQATVSKEETKMDRKKPPYRTSIEITEKIIDNEKIFVVERKPVSRTDSRSSGSIDVVTRSQFELLAAAVQQLRGIVTPQPLALPDNKQLMSDVLHGTATLPDAMQTLQVDARLRAAENAVVRMAGLLTQLASAGELPDDMFDQLLDLEQSYTEMKTEAGQAAERQAGLYRPDQVDKSFAGRRLDGKKSVAIDPKVAKGKAKADGGIGHDLSIIETTPTSPTISRPSTMSRSSRASSLIAAKVPCVTYDEMKDALKALRDDILKCLNNMTERAATVAETSLHVAKGVAEKLDLALQVDDRVSILFSVVEDYAEQLRGFDSGLATQCMSGNANERLSAETINLAAYNQQMQSFQDQMAQMRSDLQAGLVQLEKVNNNAETAVVLELTERYEELAGELESTLHAHKALTTFQEQLSAELRGLVECMEILREQKADRDEILDGLRDKADMSKLAGLLSEAEFAEVRADFERRIDLCHDKFNRQDEVWQTAIRDLKSEVDKKAELVELLAMRDDTQKKLQHINDQIRVLAAALGEPKAALVTRKLAEGTSCGACRERALMEPCERAHGAAHALPALRPPPVVATEEPCLADWAGAAHVEDRHICHRWAGGSHTLVSEWTRRVVAPPARYDLLTRKYTDYGDDGRLYKMETECQPCAECNLERAELMSEEACLQGAGDTAPEPGPQPECACPET